VVSVYLIIQYNTIQTEFLAFHLQQTEGETEWLTITIISLLSIHWLFLLLLFYYCLILYKLRSDSLMLNEDDDDDAYAQKVEYKKSKVKYVDTYSAPLGSATASRKSALISASQPYSQAFSEHCETTDTGWCITRSGCLLPQLTPGTHSAWAGSGWV